jgi:phosphomannomutase / phosphoglucomutase
MICQDIFREYDIRGLAENELTSDFVRLLGFACGKYFQSHERTSVVIGRDNRLSSERIFQDLGWGLAAAGCEIFDLGTVTTPLFYFARVHWGIDAGMMITASHNPKEFNGFKITLGPGTIYGEEIQKISQLCVSLQDDLQQFSVIPQIKKIDPFIPYMEMIREKIRLGPRRLKVVIDCGNGTASLFAEKIFKELGCEIIPLYCESDGNFPNHHPDPVSSVNCRDLIRMVRAEKADLGVGFDGDGDRLGVVDDSGRVIWGDQLMILYWREILAKYPGAPCIIEVKCSQALVEEVERLGGKPLFYRTGHSLIKAKMREIGALFTGEMSGHMFFADEYYGYDDAFYAAGRLLRIISNTEHNITQLLASISNYPSTAETRVPCSDPNKFQVIKEITQHFKEHYPVIDIDGVRVLFPGGWGLVRASNTQPVIVARCEGTNEENLKQICEIMKTKLIGFKEVGDFEWEY